LEWQPVLARELPNAEIFEAFRCEAEAQIFRGEIARHAGNLGLQPLRWPEPFPFDSELAMRAATYAKGIGRVVPFAQAAFRQAFAAGRSLTDPDTVLIAAAACEMHPAAVIKATGLVAVGERLSTATAEAARLGVSDVPAVRVGERVLIGERSLEDAAELLATGAAR
jgi:2-hydroxychromene-2-carboxylate isomerase